LLMSANVTQEQVEETFSFARHGRCENMESLLSQGVPVDVRDGHGNTLLAISCQNGNKKIAKCLLRRGANINSRNHKGNTPLHFCFHCK
jgi:ankyrin repeat protein